jgi:RimJ/RimL family protein N-acetyltransferase
MIQISPIQTAMLRERFVPERPSWLVLVGMHVIGTGNGACFVDRWPNPRAVLVETARNYSLMGDPDALVPADLEGRISGFLDAPEQFLPLLKKSFPSLKVWDRVILELKGRPRFSQPGGYTVRRLVSTDAYHLWGLTAESAWIWKSWGGPPGLASSGYAWGAFADGRLVSIACSFFVGEQYEEIGVATEPEFRGLGLSAACAGALCAEIQDRGRRPSWSTSPDNKASLRVAEKIGFSLLRRGQLYVIGVSIPEPARRQEK